MPLARIRTRQAQDAASIAEILAARGYTVETASPEESCSEPAEVEITVERHAVREALHRAAVLVNEPGAVYVARGVLDAEREALRQAADAARRQHEAAVELQRKREEAVRAEQARTVAAEKQRQEAVFLAEREQQRLKAEEARQGAEQQRRLLADQQEQQRMQAEQARAETERERQRIKLEQEQTRHEQQRVRAEQERARAEQERARAEQERIRTDHERRIAREAAERARVRAEKEDERQRFEPMVNVPAPRQRSVAPALAMTALETRVPPPPPNVERRQPAPMSRPRLRMQHRPQRGLAKNYWNGAFTAAAAVAVLIMIAWAIVIGRGPANTPSTSGVTQQIPFGPVTLAPKVAGQSSGVTLRPATPSAASAKAPIPVPANTSAAKPSAATALHTTAHRRVASHDNGIADDVVIRHFAPARAGSSSNTVASHGVKRITDQ